ncbi:exported protein of unknown function [Ralstonia solanacearum CMR15]|nr:exported protein of unknown function [Ralstonia solanacearum CMR15]
MKLSTVTAIAAWFALAAQPTIAKDWATSGDGAISSSYVAEHGGSFAPSYIDTDGDSSVTEITPLEVQRPALDRTEVIRAELHSYGGYDANWDSDGAIAPQRAHIDSAVALLGKIPSGYPLPKPMLSASGEVGLYWDHPALFADIAFEDNGAFSLFTRDKVTKKETYVEGALVSDLDAAWFAKQLQKLREA